MSQVPEARGSKVQAAHTDIAVWRMRWPSIGVSLKLNECDPVGAGHVNTCDNFQTI